MINYLKNYKEDVPEWLQNYQPGDKLMFSDIMGCRTAYYPGCGIDGNLILACNKAHCAHSFLYADYFVTVEEFREEIKRIKGYHSICHIEWSEDDVLPFGKFEFEIEYEPRRLFTRKGFTARYFTEILERDSDKDDNWGAKRFALTYLYADGIDSYFQLYIKTYHSAPFIFLLQDHGLGGNYDSFGRKGLLDKLMQCYCSHPRFVMLGGNTNIWEKYYKLANLKPLIGGMHHFRRFLYEYSLDINLLDSDKYIFNILTGGEYFLGSMELSEYAVLRTYQTKLNVEIRIDESSSYKREKHPLWIVISNPLDIWFLAMSIEGQTQQLFIDRLRYRWKPEKQGPPNISKETLKLCFDFVSKFKEIIIDVANEDVDSDAIYEILQSVDWQYVSREEISNFYTQIKERYLIPVDNKSLQ